MVGTLLTNEKVKAMISPFLNFNDQGIERSVKEGLVQVNSSSAVDKNIKISLDSCFYDSNKMGISFKLKFDDIKLLKGDIEKIGLFYSIKNGDGEYITEFTSGEKPLKGKQNVIGSFSEKNPIMDLKNGEVQYDVVLESNKGNIPKLKDAVIEVESVNFFYKESYEDFFIENNDNFKAIDGTWNLAISNKQEQIKYVEYMAPSNKSKIEILSAKASPTSFNIKFAIDTIFKNSKLFFIENIKLVNEKGEEYESQGWDLEEKDGKTIISTNIPVSSYENVNKYKLIFSNIYEAILEEGQTSGGVKQVMPDVEIELIKK
ncbi:MAG: hypothetical protein ACI8WT_000864 [Clostridium sp.]|jgi:hypothetical protein